MSFSEKATVTFTTIMTFFSAYQASRNCGHVAVIVPGTVNSRVVCHTDEHSAYMLLYSHINLSFSHF